jgi:hypothetical protein
LVDTPPSPPPQKKKPKGYRVLNPTERLVDDSLLAVFYGDKTIQEHTQENMSRQNLTWVNEQLGSILHACAVWNDSQTVNQVLAFLATSREAVAGLRISEFVNAVDGDGKTALAVAQTAGHTDVCNVLQNFGAATEDDESFIYDMYCMEANNKVAPGNTDDSNILACELDEGCTGYWTEWGELVLEPAVTAQSPQEQADDEEDSNDEEWFGNEYPDEDDSEDEGHDNTFRRRPATLWTCDDDVEGLTGDDYDAAYGILGQGEAEYDDEC